MSSHLKPELCVMIIYELLQNISRARMAYQYLPCQIGEVLEVQLPGKAILSFMYNDQPQRALLWIKCYVHQGIQMDQHDTFLNKLNPGDTVYFHCHTYNKISKDACQWYAAKAWNKLMVEEEENDAVYILNQTGYISEIDRKKGVILFDNDDREEQVFFMGSKFYSYGKRCNKPNLAEFLSENDPVQFDAQRCEPSKINKMSGVHYSFINPSQYYDDLTADDSASNIGAVGGHDIELDDFPSLVANSGVSHGDKGYEASKITRQGQGTVVMLLNEECGVALWMLKQNRWETVFFHRKNAFLDDVGLNQFDLHESLTEGTPLEIVAVPAVPQFPCRWIAHKAIAHVPNTSLES
ncbi:uncharacterized protein LOC143035039 isoform X2 [Oratosquilla oratoria]|uniref:uncharacterized protein LOC143035039 isoform X2 n=1 Tax=Oratosquilla oratoria TaxID=337810 RepID=UPI003F775CB4